MALDRSHPIPLFFQLKELLLGQVEDGVYSPGVQIPTESSLMAEHSLSRGTVRQAINELVHEGRIYRVHGRGTFVAAPPVEHRMAQSLTSLAEDMYEQAIPFKSVVLTARTDQVANHIASLLHLTPGDGVHFLERLGYAKAEPVVLAHTHIPACLCPRLLDHDLSGKALYAFLESEYGIKPARARRTLEPALADDYESELLHIKKGSPVHIMETVAYDSVGVPVEHSKLYFRGDRSRFVFDVVRPNIARETTRGEILV